MDDEKRDKEMGVFTFFSFLKWYETSQNGWKAITASSSYEINQCVGGGKPKIGLKKWM